MIYDAYYSRILSELFLNKLDQTKCSYIAYYLLKSIEKELNDLSDSLNKEILDTSSQDCFEEFKVVVEKEGESVRGPWLCEVAGGGLREYKVG